MQTFSNTCGAGIVDKLILEIQENKQYLSDIDGLIGDGDHGINMNKGFTFCRAELDKAPGNLAYSFKVLSNELIFKIGGSMGPLYGKFFKAISLSLEDKDEIGITEMGAALNAGVDAIGSLSSAKIGDKTLVDTLIPAVNAFNEANHGGKSFTEALDAMKVAASTGRDSTINMVAKLGRASRLGERSRGVPDAGAASCCIILHAMANEAQRLINECMGDNRNLR
jgi:phosphoenolpyruvate---glycerone phosphotransferase subunit DhaL